MVTTGVEAIEAALAATSATDLGRLRPGSASVYGPFLVVYRAQDEAGNEGEYASRRVYIDAGCPDSEIRCWEEQKCSEGGLCLPTAIGITAACSEPVNIYVPPVDVVPPRLELHLTEADVVLDDDGSEVVMTTVLAGEHYIDMGWIATDDVDGDLSDRVAAAWLSAVSAAVRTGAPTDRDSPHKIRYSVSDAAGNTAEVVRAVHVACSAQESTCVDRSGRAYCSVQGLCLQIESAALDVAAAADIAAPVIELVGAEEVYVEQGNLFSKCPHPRPVSMICDQVRRGRAVPSHTSFAHF